jgi:hypothetical protein
MTKNKKKLKIYRQEEVKYNKKTIRPSLKTETKAFFLVSYIFKKLK